MSATAVTPGSVPEVPAQSTLDDPVSPLPGGEPKSVGNERELKRDGVSPAIKNMPRVSSNIYMLWSQPSE